MIGQIEEVDHEATSIEIIILHPRLYIFGDHIDIWRIKRPEKRTKDI